MLPLAIDIGNTRCKFSDGERIEVISHHNDNFCDKFPAIIEGFHGDRISSSLCEWWIASVNRPKLKKIVEWIEKNRPGEQVYVLNYKNIPIKINVDFPEKVGVDRLLAAVTANELRDPFRPAIVVDLGTAVKVDFIDENGIFCGGAIAPGLRMSAIAMEQQTDALPKVDIEAILRHMNARDILSVGKNTLDAIQAGLFWGVVGTIRELVTQTTTKLDGKQKPEVFLTGGGALTVCEGLGDEFLFVDEMVMKGIRTTIRHTI